MREAEERARIHQAIDRTLSGLTGDPWLFQRISAAAGKEAPKMKRKLSAGLVLAIVIALLATAALAAALLTHQQFIEQVAVPMANENDGAAGVNLSYTPDQLADLVRALNENGITLEENNRIMQLIKNGAGYWEEETIMELCRQAFGGNIGTWTLEQQDWFGRLMVEIGYFETYESRLPGPENMTYEQAEAFAFAALRSKYGADLPLEDRTVFTLERSFYKDSEGDLSDETWYFGLQAKDLYHGRYTVHFADSDPERTVQITGDVPDWTKPYTGEELLDRMRRVCGWSMGRWPQDGWQAFHELLLGATEAPGTVMSPELKAYQLTEYPDPAGDDLSREAAIRIADTAGLDPRAALDGAVLTAYEGRRYWLVSYRIFAPMDGPADEAAGWYAVSVSSPEGAVDSVRKEGRDDNSALLYTPQAAYEKALEGRLKVSDAIRLAAEAIRAKHPELDLLNEDLYQVYADGYKRYNIRFVSRDVRFGDASATVLLDGTVTGMEADTAPLTGDTLMDRYWSAYGYYGEWPQERWEQLSRDMQALDPVGTEGKLLRQARYPAESTARIPREQAIALAIAATGKRTAEAHTCILIGADPHPVWKLRMLTDDMVNPMIELDAETGEVLGVDRYKVDYTPRWHVFTLERDWRPAEFTPDDLEALARTEISFAYSNMALDEPDFDLDRPDAWTYEQDGLTARFIARWAGLDDYEVTFNDRGFVVSIDRHPSTATAPDPASTRLSVPTPRPDGKPWCWGMDFAEPAFWTQLEQAMQARGVDAFNLEEKKAEWDAEYGDDMHWPQDIYVINYFLEASAPDDFDHIYPIFPIEGKKTKEEIVAIASAAFRQVAEPEFGAAWVDGTWCAASLWNDGYNYNAVDETYARPVWWVEFFTGTLGDWQSCGYAQLDEDGNVLDVQQEMSNG